MALSHFMALASLLVGSLAAQAPTFTTFGNPCQPSAPPLAALNLPRIGQVFRLQVLSAGSNGVPYEGGYAAALFAGSSRTTWQGRALPWTAATLQGMGVGACGDLAVAADYTTYLPFFIPRTLVTIALPIPNAAALIGTSVFFQAADFRSSFRAMSVDLGVAGEARIGV